MPSGSPSWAILTGGNCASWGTTTVGSTGSTGFRFTIFGVGGVSCRSENRGSLPSEAGVFSRRPPPPPPPDFLGLGGRFRNNGSVVNWVRTCVLLLGFF